MLENTTNIYCENCIDTMAQMPENYVDLVVTSPPYDDLRDYNGYTFDYKEIVKSLYRVIKDGGVVVWVVGDASINGSETGTSFRQALYFKEIGFNIHDTMIYQKQNPPPIGGNRYYSSFEYMFVFSKGSPKTFNPLQRERKYTVKGKTERIRKKSTIRNKSGKFIEEIKTFPLRGTVKKSNIWTYKVGGSHSVEKGESHPAKFPDQLAIDHILSWSNEGDLVYDPMAGSGTTLLMAKRLGRKFVGSEISEEYCLKIEQKLKDF